MTARIATLARLLVLFVAIGCSVGQLPDPAPTSFQPASSKPAASIDATVATLPTPTTGTQPTDDTANSYGAPDLTPAPPARATPTPRLSPQTPVRPFFIDLYRDGAFASQSTTYYCVPASIEMMLNLIDGRPFDTSAGTQDDLYGLVRDYLIQPYWGKGGQPEGWADTLNHESGGSYQVAIRNSREAAVTLAARELRQTGKPVGLLVWRGYHAWVMTGFKATADPAATADFQVTSVFVEDPWFPRISKTWGPGQKPDTELSPTRLANYFLPYDQHGEGGLDKDGKFVVIIPTR